MLLCFICMLLFFLSVSVYVLVHSYARLQSPRFAPKVLQELTSGCNSSRGWIRCFERWQCIASHISSNGVDPLIPSGNIDKMSIAEKLLSDDLKLLDTMSSESAVFIAAEITRKATILSSALNTLLSSRSSDESYYDARVLVSTGSFGIELMLSQEDAAKAQSNLQRRFPVNNEILSRLSQRYTAATGLPAEGEAFYESLFVLLCRYQALEGYGWQAAVGNPVLECLKSDFNVTAECFASPLNAHLNLYCSAFPDIDHRFGSSGSFFEDFSPTCGSFHSNPPFVTFLMVAMVHRMEMLLAQTSEPLSFAVIVPLWTDSAHWLTIKESRFNCGVITLLPQEHTFLNGNGYQRPVSDIYFNRPAPFESAIFFLQNEAGRVAYPLTSAREKSLRAAFASVPVSPQLLQKSAEDNIGDERDDGMLPRYIPKRLRK